MLTMPEDADERWTVHGPYKRKDGRQHVVIVERNVDGSVKDKETRSYPKYLVQELKQDMLEIDDTVDHLDRDFTNNNPGNLKVRKLAKHAFLDALRVFVEPVNCPVCSTVFTPTRNQTVVRKSGNPAGPFCSRSCSGKYGTHVQNGGAELDRTVVNKTYYRLDKDK